MKIFSLGKNLADRLTDRLRKNRARDKAPSPARQRHSRISGNVFFALFAAVGMVGAVGYGFNSVIKGPISSMTEVTRRTVAENTVITASRLAIVGATTQQAHSGDCDGDGAVEPLPFSLTGTGPSPVGGGYLPDNLLPDKLDPWSTEYGYCAWDSGSLSVSDAVVGCNPQQRLQGSPLGNQYAIAIISAGKNRRFETTCNAYIDTTPADDIPDTPLIVRASGSDDIVLAYTYAEANDLGNGLWKPKSGSPDTAITDKNLEVTGTGGGKFSDAVVMQGNTATGGGLILPGDPGDNSITGICDAINANQLRRNTGDDPPSIEICDFGGLGWTPVSGGAATTGTVTGQLVGHWKLNETSGNYAKDSVGNKDGLLNNTPTWDGGRLGGALTFSRASTEGVRVARTASLESSAVSIAFWVKRSGALGQANTLITKIRPEAGANNHSYGVSFDSSNRISWITGFAGPANNNLTSTSTFAALDSWTHIVAVYDPSSPPPQKRIYVNGALDSSTTVTTALNYNTTTNGDLYFGARQPSDTDALEGTLDDIRIYNFGLTDAEANELYSQVTPNSLKLTKPMTPGTLFSWGDDTNEKQGNGATEGARTIPGLTANNDNYVQVSGGTNHSCGVKADGTAWCWGSDANGKLGDGGGAGAAQASAVQVSNLSNVIKISASTHTCALRNDGTAWCWGPGAAGQIGNGANTATNDVPVQVSNINDFIDIAAGDTFTCGVRYDGTAWCWGEGENGNLGNGGTADSNIPVKVSTVTDFVSIHAGMDATDPVCGVTKKGFAYCWGVDTNGQLGNGATATQQNAPSKVVNIEDFVKVTVANHSACGLRGGGQIWCWGAGGGGQMGNGTTTATNADPVQVSNYTDFIDVSSNYAVNCGLRMNGEAYCWGTGNTLGNGNGALSSVPSKALLPPNVIKLGDGGNSVFAIVDSSSTTASPSEPRRGRVAKGEYHSCFLKNDNSIACAGLDTNGQLGNGAVLTAEQDIPSAINSTKTWTRVYAGGLSTCGIQSDGSAWCWGDDASGQLGNGGTAGNQVSPSAVTPDVGPWSMLSVGYTSTCGITFDGRGWCWGDDTNGQLGNGATGAQTGPVANALVAGGGTWTTISMGATHACGIKSDGTAWCWGSDANGRLGNGSALTADQTSPSQVAGGGLWIDISAGGGASGTNSGTCGIKIDGSAWCWGPDSHGQVGNGATLTADQDSPSPVAEPGPWKKIVARGSVACGLKVDGTAWCWGNDTNGQLGNGAVVTANQNVPSPVIGGASWVDISSGSGGSFMCGEKTDGSFWCWGQELNGRFGNGAITANQESPGPVLLTTSSFISTDAAEGYSAALAQANMAIGTTRITNTDGGTTGLNFPGGGQSILRQTTGGNQFLFESNAPGGAAQLGIGGNSNDYYLGMNISQGNFQIGPSGSDYWLGTTSGFDVSNIGFVGIGTHGAPVAKLDVRGGIRLGDAGPTCNGGLAGTMKYADGAVTYCDGSDWVSINGEGGGGGGGETTPWDFREGSITIGSTHSCGLKYDGKAYCWGSAANGRLGNGTTTPDQSLPVPVLNGEGPGVYTQIVAGQNHTCGLAPDGKAYCWGTAAFGPLGNGTTTPDQTSPVAVLNGAGPGVYTQIVLGANHTCGLAPDGKAYCWGTATSGRLGNGTTTPNQTSPVAVLNGTGPGVYTQIVAGQANNCGLAADGKAYCWGIAANGRLGNGTTTPNQTSPVAVLNGAGPGVYTKIVAGGVHICGLTANGTAYCWGSATSARLGNGTTTPDQTSPVAVLAGAGPGVYTQIVANLNHSCGLAADGTAWCWGTAASGRLGNGATTPDQTSPVAVLTGAGPGIYTQLSVGGSSSCGLAADGKAYCWGNAANGILGNGTTTPNQTSPVLVLEPAP